jgi:hypothetical protein
MSDVIARSGTNEWSMLLAETRHALETLSAEDLEELAARAECMLAATLGLDTVRQYLPRPQGTDLIAMTQQQRLLGDLLRATDQNLAVLHRLHNRAGDRHRAGEVNSRWVR